jgi:spermidine synthase
VAILFAFTLFVSAALLFLVQPMIARMILPALGGTPAVWNTCMVFFQAALLAGYAYAHAAPAWLGVRRHLGVHGLLLLLPLAFLPLAVLSAGSPPPQDNPIVWLLVVLTAAVGAPFFLVATSAPLLQTWFAASGHPAAKDPYFLYGASNTGSMLALVGYPTLVEPHLTLDQQSWLWTAGYVLLALLTVVCATFGPRPASASAERAIPKPSSDPGAPKPTPRQYAHWIALAFVPSSLMLGVTTYFTTDIAAIPLLWVVPLASYLLSFIVVFARRQWVPHETWCRAWPLVLVGLIFLMISSGTHQMHAGVAMLAHIVGLFVAAMVCHGELARHRPGAAHLTAFYLCMSLGGVLGGLFNALLAPLIFTHVIEYPLSLVLVCFLLPPKPRDEQSESRGPATWSPFDLIAPALAALLTGGVVMGLLGTTDSQESTVSWLRGVPPAVSALVVFLPALLLCFACSARPIRFGLAIAAVLLASFICKDLRSDVLHRERGFFGDLHVRHDSSGRYVQLIHGTTLHGMQSRDPASRGEPLTYFHKTGPVGQLFAALAGEEAPRRVAVMGLGIGTLASYATPGQDWTYYEIDPAVVRLAWDPRYFTYLQDAQKHGARMQVVLGDARLKMAEAEAGAYDLIVLDVFSSDSVPVHLLTHEAIALYLDKLAPGGRLVFHISNRYLHLEPVLAAAAAEARLCALICDDAAPTDVPGKRSSTWAVMARAASDLAPLRTLPAWRTPEPQDQVALWTDDFSNVLRIFRWR